MNDTKEQKTVIHNGFSFTSKYEGTKATLCNCKYNRNKKTPCTANIKVFIDGTIEEKGSHDKTCYVKCGVVEESYTIEDFTSEMAKMTEDLALKIY